MKILQNSQEITNSQQLYQKRNFSPVFSRDIFETVDVYRASINS